MMDCLPVVPAIIPVVTVIVPAVMVPVIAVPVIMVPVVHTYVFIAIITVVTAADANHHIYSPLVVPIVITERRGRRAGGFVYYRGLPDGNPNAA
jgi:hypothetical protein